MNTLSKLMIIVCLLASLTWGDAGVLLPREKAQPDPAILSLEEMEIDIRIDNSDARVFVRQIFANHTSAIEEGNYIFAFEQPCSGFRLCHLGRAGAHSGRDSGAQARRRGL